MNRAVTGRTALATLLAASLAFTTIAADLEVPYLAGRVNDLADLLSPDAETALETRLQQLEESTGTQVAVLTIPSLEGEVLEDFSLRVAETWKLGRGQFDDGVLLLIARDDRKMRVEVGYGLEGTIPDAYAKRIADDIMQPHFRAGDFDRGVTAAVDALAGLVKGDDSLPPPGSGSQTSQPASGGPGAVGFLFFLIPIGLFSLQALATRGCMAWFLYVFLMPFWFLFPLAFFGRPGGFVPFGLWVLVFPVLWAVIHNTAGGKRWLDTGSGPFLGRGGGWSSSRGGWGGFGGGFSGGGFSGGGGSFGGGGASGSW